MPSVSRRPFASLVAPLAFACGLALAGSTASAQSEVGPPPGGPPPGFPVPQGPGAPPPGYGYAPAYAQPLMAPPAWQWDPAKERWRDMRPKTLPYREGAQAPEGYEFSERVNLALTITGATLLGGSYIASTVLAVVFEAKGRDGVAPLYVPLVGPFIAAGTATGSFDRDERAVARSLFVLDGLVQCGSAAMLVAGIALRSPKFRRVKLPEPPAPYAPRVSLGFGRIAATFTY